MSNGITLSPKHGVNPTIPVCFFCGQPKNEIALMGRVYERDKRTGKKVLGSDLEAPKNMVLDYEPCDHCKEQFALGVTLIGVNEHQPDDGRPPMTAQGGAKVYPTGGFAVMTPEGVERVFNMSLEKGDKLFVDHAILTDVLGAAQ